MLLLQNYLEKYFNWEFGKYQRFIYYLELKKAEHFCFWKKKISKQTQKKNYLNHTLGVSKYSGHYSI